MRARPALCTETDGIGPVNALWTENTPTQPVQSGTQSSEYEQFTAPWHGQQVHGLIFALTDVGAGFNNQQLTQDPTTGMYYYAPYDSYESDGPNGSGYYLNDRRLNIINRQ